MKYKWLLFDLDNTLLDFDGAAITAFQKTLSVSGIASQPHYYKLYKKINHQVWTAFENKEINAVELRTRRFELFLQSIEKDGFPAEMSKQYLSFIVEHSNLLQGARALLDHLQPQYQMAIITNGLKEVQRPRISLTKIGHYFETIVVSDEIGHAKPDAAFFDYTFNQIRQPKKEEVLVIGDSLNSDIKGGNNYGMDTCWCNLKQEENTSNQQPTFEINDLKELTKYISR
jgi:YjjG family noncanonical pyrimidine nucleotidase